MDLKIWTLQGDDFDKAKEATEAFKQKNKELRSQFEAKQKELAGEYWKKVFPIVGLDYEKDTDQLLTVDTEHEDRGLLIIKNHLPPEETEEDGPTKH